jgi:hypothetical protein
MGVPQVAHPFRGAEEELTRRRIHGDQYRSTGMGVHLAVQAYDLIDAG